MRTELTRALRILGVHPPLLCPASFLLKSRPVTLLLPFAVAHNYWNSLERPLHAIHEQMEVVDMRDDVGDERPLVCSRSRGEGALPWVTCKPSVGRVWFG